MLHFPHGLEVVGKGWFRDSDREKVFLPNTVRELGEDAFCSCEKLREVVFEPDSQLETIGDSCFEDCGLKEVFIPRSVRDIGNRAFFGCRNLRSLTFENGSWLKHVGERVIDNTQLTENEVEFPSAS